MLLRAARWRSARLLLLGIATVTVGCAYAEQPLLEQFFNASRLRDTIALQAISTVVFEPAQDGIVRTFRIVSVTPETQSGKAVVKRVTVRADVILPDGRAVQRTLLVAMQRSRYERGSSVPDRNCARAFEKSRACGLRCMAPPNLR